MKTLLLISALLLFGSLGQAQTCSTTSWCQTTSNSQWPNNNGWNKLVFSHDTGKFYIYASTASIVTFENAFWSYTTLGSVASSNPYTQISSCGDTTTTSIVSKQLTLASPGISPTDTSLTFNVVGSSGLANAFPLASANNSIWVGDESLTWTSCSSTGGGGTCGAGSTAVTLSGLTRGQKTSVGWKAAYAHSTGEAGSTSCIAPSPGIDHPPSRHPVGNLVYDSKRGQLWQGWGYQETWQFQDLWHLCIFAPSSGPSDKCTSGSIALGWQRQPVFSTNPNPIAYTENASVYDPDNDVIISFGGLKGGSATADTFVYCLAANSAWVDSTHTCASAGYVGSWRKVTAHGGSPGGRDAARMVWDSTNHRILTFGGTGTAGLVWHTVAQYNSATGDWCLSDTSQGGSNASSCSLPAVSGVAPNPTSTKFPPWAFLPNLSPPQAVLYADDQAVYTYDAAGNVWTKNVIPGGPALPTQRSGVTWDYDDINHVLVMVVSNAAGVPNSTWQLPSAALGPSLSPPGSPTGLTATPGNAQIGLNWTAPTTGGAPTSYTLKRSTTSGSGYSNVVTQAGTSYTDTGRTNGTTYFYVVVASNAGGTSANSSEASATPVSGPEGTPSPLTLSFGKETLTIPSAAQSVTLTSSGGSSLTSIVISTTGDFSQTNNCPGTLTVSATCTINVKFTPTVPGLRVGTVQIANNASDSPQSVSLSGTGVVPHPTVITGALVRR